MNVRTIDINDLDRIEKSFSPAERRRIDKCCQAIERVLASSRAAFNALGSPVDDANADGEMHTAFITAITPELLEDALPRMDRLRAFFHQEWRKATGTQARTLARAERHCDVAAEAIRTRLAELEPVMNEQNLLLGQLEHALKRLKESTCTH